MSLVNISKCVDQQQFMETLKGIELTLSTLRTIEKSQIDKITKFFDCNISYIVNDQTAASRFYSIEAKVILNFSYDSLVCKVQNKAHSVLKEKPNDYFKSLADGINLMEIPLASLNLSEEDFYNVVRKLCYIDLRNLDLSRYDLKKITLDLFNPNFTFKNSDEGTTYDIVKCAVKVTNAIARHIKKFGIENKERLYEIAKLCAQKDGYATAVHFKNFELEDKTHSYEIAKLCVQQDGCGTTLSIENFGIDDKKQLFELAKLSAQQSGGGTALYINNYGINDKTLLLEIANLCAQQSGYGTARYIKNFRIEDRKQLFELATICAQQSGFGTAAFIQNFGIDDNSQLLEIAKLCIQQDGGGTAECIGNFRFEDKTQLFELAKLCAQKDGGKTALSIRNFKIEDKTQLFEIAKLCAQHCGFGTADNIKNFEIDDKTQLLELAKLCAQQNGDGTAECIKNFAIDDKTLLFEIAMLCAQQNGNGTAEYIKNFGIDDKTHLYEIAKLCVRQTPRHVMLRFKNFGIKDKTQIFEIAKLCAQQDGGATAACIRNFRIKDKTQLFEIAKLCAQQDGDRTAQCIQNFEIGVPQLMWELFLECFKSDNSSLGAIRSFLPLPDFMGDHLILLAVLLSKILKSPSPEKVNRAQFFKEVKSFIDNKEQLAKICDEIANSPIHIQNETAPWLLKILFLSFQMQPKDLNWIFENELLLKLSKLHEPRLRSLLTPGLFELSKSKGNMPKGTHGLPLIAIPFYQLEQQGVSRDKLKEICENLKRKQNKENSLKNAVTVQTILHTIHLLASTYSLSPEEKIRAIDKIFYKLDQSIEDNVDILLKRIAAVRGLLQMQNYEWPNSTKDPADEFRASFESLIPIKDIQGVVSERFEEIFGKCRNPFGLITYAAGLKTLKEPEVMDCLGRYVSSVFNGTFKKIRYETANNSHLKTISESHQHLLELWKKDIEKPLEISQKDETNLNFDPKKWIKTKLIDDRHLGETDIPFIEDYLNANTTEERELVSCKLTEEFQKAPNEILKLQQTCIAFAEAKLDNFIPLLQEIKACVDPRTEFSKDLAGMLRSKKTFSELKIVITDDPIDLLLCGSDVTGSCQRLDGHPSLNKGLLGYLMDGKNRLLAIKDGKGKIVARCLLRLLWNGESPVIYRERIYPDYCESRQVNALNQAAKELAKELKVPLTGADKGTPYGKPLHALGGPAPYEYCDGCCGMQKGPYKIEDANLLTEGEV